MTKPVLSSDHKYRMGQIIQICKSCSWQAERQKLELDYCMECGGEMTLPKLQFGGLEIILSGKNRFTLENPNSGESVYIDEADVSDTIAFLLRHSSIWLD